MARSRYRSKRRPSGAAQRHILDLQSNRCIYCAVPFHGIQPHWDHFEPHSLAANNQDNNFVAACMTCNCIKASLFFYSLEEAREFICARRIRKGLPVYGVVKRMMVKHECSYCGENFKPSQAYQKTCSSRCAAAFKRAAKRSHIIAKVTD